MFDAKKRIPKSLEAIDSTRETAVQASSRNRIYRSVPVRETVRKKNTASREPESRR